MAIAVRPAVLPRDARPALVGHDHAAWYAAVDHTHPSTTTGHWRFSTATVMTDPGTGYFRSDTGSALTASTLAFSMTTSDGAQAPGVSGVLRAGDELYIQDLNDNTRYARYRLTAAGSSSGAYFTVPVALVVAGAAPVANNAVCSVTFQTGGGGGGADPYPQYLTQAEGDARYLLPATAASTYLPLVGGTLTGDLVLNEATPTVSLKQPADTQPRTRVVDTALAFGPGGTTAPDWMLQRVSAGSAAISQNVQIQDSLGAQTKGYRFRTSGSALDLEASGAQVYVSNWSGANYSGTQYFKLLLENGADITQALGQWQWRTGPNGSTTASIVASSGNISTTGTLTVAGTNLLAALNALTTRVTTLEAQMAGHTHLSGTIAAAGGTAVLP